MWEEPEDPGMAGVIQQVCCYVGENIFIPTMLTPEEANVGRFSDSGVSRIVFLLSLFLFFLSIYAKWDFKMQTNNQTNKLKEAKHTILIHDFGEIQSLKHWAAASEGLVCSTLLCCICEQH